MSAKTILFAVACIGLIAAAAAMPGKSGGKGGKGHHKGPHCCKMMPNMLSKDTKSTCFPPRQGPPPPPPPQSQEEPDSAEKPKHGNNKGNMSCAIECVFKEEKWLDADNKVDMAAMKTKVDSMATENPDWKPILDDAYTKCSATPVAVPEKETCKSGAGQFSHCMMREMRGKCPVSARVDKPECADKYKD